MLPTDSAEATPAMHVTVVCALGPHQVLQACVAVRPGATALDALRSSGITEQLPAGLLDSLAMGIWGRACTPGAVLQPDDRLELTRPLTVDPKESRRLRFRRDGLRRKRKGQSERKSSAAV